MNYKELSTNALNNPATSDWLKKAIVELERRDVLDAQLDAAYLAKLCSLRADEALGRSKSNVVNIRGTG